MAELVILPRQGQSVETCQILRWRKREGDPVREGETLVEVETDKAVFELPSTAGGTVLTLLHAEGDDVPVLAGLAIVGRPGEDISALLGRGTASPGGAAEEIPPAASPVAEPEESRAAARLGGRISPRARRFAESSGLSLGALLAEPSVVGSGPRGRILERDVQAALERLREPKAAPQAVPHAPAAAPAGWVGPVTERPVKGARRLIAERMLASLQSSAQYTLHASACAEALLALRRRLKARAPEAGAPEAGAPDSDVAGITLNDFVNYAASRQLPRYPELNAHFDGTVLRLFERVHLGVAVDTPRGLMVPVVRDAGRLSLRALAAETARLQQACLDGTVGADELGGGTFTVSNLGPLGVEGFTPVLNPPQVAILGVGGTTLRPVETEAGVVFRRYLSLSLTANHQVVDGAPAARFLRALAAALESFELLLLE